MLTRVHVDNFRCFVNFECRLGPQQLLLGPNGAGKSTFFDVLTLLRDFCVRGEASEERFAGRTRTRWQDVRQQTFELDVSGNTGSYQMRLVMDSWGNPERPRVPTSGRLLIRFTVGRAATQRLGQRASIRCAPRYLDSERSAESREFADCHSEKLEPAINPRLHLATDHDGGPSDGRFLGERRICVVRSTARAAIW